MAINTCCSNLDGCVENHIVYHIEKYVNDVQDLKK